MIESIRKFSFAATLLLMTVPATSSVAQNLRPLQDAINQEPSLQMLNYLAARCSALFLEVATRTAKTPSATQEDEMLFKGRYAVLAQEAGIVRNTMLGRSEDRSAESFTESLEMIMEIKDLYFEDMESNYARTGNSMSQQHQIELALCNKYYNGLTNG